MLDEAMMPKRSGLRRIAAIVFRIGMAVLLGLIGLTLLYGFLPAPSTLMIGRWLTLRPVEQQWIRLDEMSPLLVKAVIASEDQRFCSHRGIDFVELSKVLSDEAPGRGASSLTMQTAKNVFLWPGRSLLRKGIELPLALALDLVWGKRRVLEIYLNIAEWGDGLFGAEAAARHYFGKPASALSALEAARLAAVLPNPILRDPARPSAGVRAATRRVLARMADIEPLAGCVLP